MLDTVVQGHMRRLDVDRIVYSDDDYLDHPWESVSTREKDLLNWEFNAEFVTLAPLIEIGKG